MNPRSILLSSLSLTASLLLLSGCSASQGAPAWEYKVVRNLGTVNEMAKEGWIVDGFTEYRDAANANRYEAFLLKRPRQ
jgi:hypothetical protein